MFVRLNCEEGIWLVGSACLTSRSLNVRAYTFDSHMQHPKNMLMVKGFFFFEKET